MAKAIKHIIISRAWTWRIMNVRASLFHDTAEALEKANSYLEACSCFEVCCMFIYISIAHALGKIIDENHSLRHRCCYAIKANVKTPSSELVN